MRWIFFSLLLANIALLAWWQWLAPAAPTPVAVTAPDAVPAQTGDSLTLLSELEQPALQRRRLPDQPPPEGAALCTLAGPFEARERGEQLVERLRALDYRLKLMELELTGEATYWVYLPPAPSTKAALRQLRELQAKNIDSYHIPQGRLADGISLGVYSSRDNAQSRQAALVEQGYDAQITEMARTYREMWVVFAPGADNQPGERLWQELLVDWPGLERRMDRCESVASEDDFL